MASVPGDTTGFRAEMWFLEREEKCPRIDLPAIFGHFIKISGIGPAKQKPALSMRALLTIKPCEG